MSDDDFPTSDDDVGEPHPDPDRDQDALTEEKLDALALMLRGVTVHTSGLTGAELVRAILVLGMQETDAALPSSSPEQRLALLHAMLDDLARERLDRDLLTPEDH